MSNDINDNTKMEHMCGCDLDDGDLENVCKKIINDLDGLDETLKNITGSINKSLNLADDIGKLSQHKNISATSSFQSECEDSEDILIRKINKPIIYY